MIKQLSVSNLLFLKNQQDEAELDWVMSEETPQQDTEVSKVH